jgi:hypothetical protein
VSRGAERNEELAALTAVVAALSATGVAVGVGGGSEPTGFGDGAAYRAMARGEPGTRPFHRRVLMPAMVRGLQRARSRHDIDAPEAFRAVALASVAAGAIGTGLLAARVARCCGASRTRCRLAGTVAGALVPAMPHSTRMTVQIPMFNDQLAVALGALWLLLAPSPRQPLAPPAALAAALTREQWGLVVAAVLPVLRRSRALPAAHLAALGTAAGVVLTRQPAADSEVYPPALALRRLASRQGATEIGWGLWFTGGLLPVLLPAALRQAAGYPALAALLRVVAVQTCLALVGGSDTPRLLYGGLPFLTASTVGVATANRDPRLTPVLAGTMALWRPLTRLAGSERAYEEHFLPYMHGLLPRRLGTDAARVLGGLGVVAVVRRYLSRPDK